MRDVIQIIKKNYNINLKHMDEYDFDNFNDFQESHHFSDIFLNDHEI